MSSTGQVTPLNSQLIIDALADYAKQTGIDLARNPIAEKIELSSSPETVLGLLQERESLFEGYRDVDLRLMSCFSPAVKVLCAFSGILGDDGEAVSLIPSSPANAIFTSIDVLFAAASDVTSSYDALLELFECLGDFLKCLEIYTAIPPTTTMTDFIIKIMIEVLSVFALATKYVKQGQFINFSKKLLGESDVEAVLQKLGQLSQDEARMTVSQTLGVVHDLVRNVRIVMEDGKVSSDGIREALVSLHQMLSETNKAKRNKLEKEEDIDKAYKQALLVIDETKRKYAQRLFQCLTVSIRPLRVDELAEILAVCFESDFIPNYHAGWLSGDTEALLSACSDLVTVADVDGFRVVQFSHHSVKEFLTSERLAATGDELSSYHILPGPAHTIMAKACLNTLVKLDDSADKNAVRNFPLALYAAQHWIEHAQFGDVSSRIKDVMFRLFDPDKPHFRAWIWLYDMDRHWENHMSTTHPTRPQASSLYYAALCGFSDLVERLVRTHPSEINANGGYHITPLLASLGRGHEKITSLLLREGADVDVRDNDGSTPLHKACRAGNLEVVRLLLTHRADIHARNRKKELPLHLAAFEGEAEICRLLIKHGANIYCKDNQEWTPLHYGSRFGHLEVVKMLLDLGVDVDAKKKDDWTALHLASANGKFQVAHMLIQRGAAIEARNDEQETPLDRAAANGHVKVARLLLDSGANVNVVDKRAWTPLHAASRYGYHEIVELLVGSGANVNAGTDSLETPLLVACGLGKLEVARILIKGGSNTDARDKEGWTPLHSAIRFGRLDVVRLLLDSGADVNLPKTDQWTPIHIASANGHLDITELLVGRGAVVDSRNDKGETPLDRAVLNGFFDIARFLIENGAAVSARDNKGWTPFHTAARCGHIHIVKYLLDRGVAVDDRNENGETSLDLASSNGKLDVVRFLIDNGADFHAKDKKGWNSLHIASRNGHLEVVRMLLDAGTSVDIRNSTQRTPLALASNRGIVEVARLLIERHQQIREILSHFQALSAAFRLVGKLQDSQKTMKVRKYRKDDKYY